MPDNQPLCNRLFKDTEVFWDHLDPYWVNLLPISTMKLYNLVIVDSYDYFGQKHCYVAHSSPSVSSIVDVSLYLRDILPSSWQIKIIPTTKNLILNTHKEYIGTTDATQWISSINNLPDSHIQDIHDSTAITGTKFLLQLASKTNASDIHFIPDRTHYHIKMRIDGLLSHQGSVPLALGKMISNRLKFLSHLPIEDKPASGSIRTYYGTRIIDLRVSSHPTIWGSKINVRLLPQFSTIPTLQELGLTEQQTQALIKLINQPQGLILFGGSTGSGKSTTMHSLLQNVAHKGLNIMTFEDPVEYKASYLTQTDFALQPYLSMEELLKSALRQDPDILMISEIRDNVTANYVLQAALTGHLVLSSIHIGQIQEVIARLQELDINIKHLATILKGIVMLKLLPLKCSQCSPGGSCSNCYNTGYKGRKLVAQIMDLSSTHPEKIIEIISSACLLEEYQSTTLVIMEQ